MRKTVVWMSALISLALLCAPALADPGAEGGKKARKARTKKEKPARKKKPSGEYGMMVSVLKMDEAQAEKLNQAVQKYQEAMKAWEAGASGQKYKELNDAAKKAREDKDKEKMKSIAQDMKSVRKERDDLEAAEKAKIMEVLTEEQKAEWKGFTLYRSTVGRYKRLNLTEDQDRQLRDLCKASAKDMPPSSDRKAYGAARKKLAQDIEEKILTDAQREELKKQPEKKAREPKERKPREKKAKGGKKKGNQPVILE